MHDAPDELVADDPPWWRQHFFIQHDKPFGWWWLALPLALLLLALAAAFGIDRIQDDLTDRTVSELERDASIDFGGDIDIDFDGRSGTITGVLPAGMTVADVERRIEALDGVRDIDVSGLVEAPEPEPEPEPDPEPEPEPEPEPAVEATGLGLDVQADFAGSTITLDGSVLSASEADQLREAAAAAVGADNVIDNLTVADPENSTDTSVARVAALAASFAAFGTGVDGATVELDDSDLTYRALADNDATAEAFRERIAGIGTDLAVDGAIDVMAVEPDPSEQINQLQEGLDGLAEEIRETVVFGTGGTTLSAEAQATLDKAVALINGFTEPVVEVGGHTDDLGGEAGNQALSAARAQAVADYLVEAGVDAARVTAVGYGETQPRADNTTEEGRLQNRRVELVAMAGAA